VKLDLAKPGVVLFLGTMNAMPMMYARELQQAGQKVVYLVDVPPSDKLSRPEHQYADVHYPYPDWILEWRLPSQLLLSLAPALCYRLLRRRLAAVLKGQPIKAVFAGGQFVALSRFFPTDCVKILLSYGADLEWFCNPAMIDALSDEFAGKSFTRYLPYRLTKALIGRCVHNNYLAATQQHHLLFFPPGFSEKGDVMVARLQALGVHYIPRLDVSFLPLQGFDRSYKPRDSVLQILCPVRFHYQHISEQAHGENKGNDKIIAALARFACLQPRVQVHFFEKGPDVAAAKALCEQKGLAPYVVWHQQMSLPQLLALYQQADICFDQVGEHWMGAVGIYALYFGKPLIVNAANLTYLPALPLYQAATEDEIFAQLQRLTDEALAKANYAAACDSAERYFGPSQVLAELCQ